MERRFTKKATDTLNAALRIAGELGHTCIGSEHVLLGILGQGDSAGAKILAKQGISYEMMLEKVKEHLGSGVKTELSASDMTSRTKAIIQSAAYECTKRGGAAIGTEHLLFAILLMRDSIAVKLLLAAGCDLASAGNELIELMKGESGGVGNGIGEGASDGRTAEAEMETLGKYGKDLTAMAKSGKLDPVI